MTSGFHYDMVRRLMEAGYPRRKASRAVKALVAAMQQALRRGETLELPIGTFKVVPNLEAPKRRVKFRNRIATYNKERNRVVFEAKTNWEGLVYGQGRNVRQSVRGL